MVVKETKKYHVGVSENRIAGKRRGERRSEEKETGGQSICNSGTKRIRI